MNDINRKKTVTDIDGRSVSNLSLFSLVGGSVSCAGSIVFLSIFHHKPFYRNSIATK